MKIELDPDGGNNFYVLGTNSLSSVPYALLAKNAEEVDWSNIQNKIFADSTKDGILSFADWNRFNNTGSSFWKMNNHNLYYNDGNVGIGTSAPDFKLQIVDSNNKVVIGYQPAYDGPFLNLYSSITEAAPMLAFGVAKREYYKYERVLALKDWAYIYGNNLNLGVSILPDMQYAPEGLYIKRGLCRNWNRKSES